MVIPDTSVWVDYLNGITTPQTEWIEDNLALVATADLVLVEILQGVRDERAFELTLNRLTQLEVFETGGRQVAIAAARNYRSLRKRGITIRKTIDCLIATFCIENGHTLLHNDRDFDPFEQHLGLTVIHPS